MATITLDLVSYEVVEEQERLTIKDCRGSVLGKLDNDPSVTGNRFSDELKYVLLENIWAQAYFEDDDLVFDTSMNSRATPTLQLVMEWIDEFYDAIDSIGYEVLNAA